MSAGNSDSDKIFDIFVCFSKLFKYFKFRKFIEFFYMESKIDTITKTNPIQKEEKPTPEKP